MSALAFAKQRVGMQMGSSALVADTKRLGFALTYRFRCLSVLALSPYSADWGADPIGALAMLPVIVWQVWETRRSSRTR
jgi:divalent metal cation (Fe/Co/Zn/Cd) transporter